jgi:hypothetical protein
MDEENTTKIIKEKFDALPQMVQEVILSSDYQNTLVKIGQQYNFNVEQMGILERETTMAMMGLTPLKDFEKELTRELNIDREKGANIVKDINEKVFLRIRDLLKLMNTPTGEEPTVDENAEGTQMKIGRIDAIMPKRVDLKTPEKDVRPDVQTLSNAGIEIIPGELEILPPQTPSILAQKLSTPVQTPPVKTDHSLPGITPPSLTTYPKNGDPYRLPPE